MWILIKSCTDKVSSNLISFKSIFCAYYKVYKVFVQTLHVWSWFCNLASCLFWHHLACELVTSFWFSCRSHVASNFLPLFCSWCCFTFPLKYIVTPHFQKVAVVAVAVHEIRSWTCQPQILLMLGITKSTASKIHDTSSGSVHILQSFYKIMI